MADTGAPLHLPLLPRGEGNWDDDLNTALQAINDKAAAHDTSLAAKADLVTGKIPTGQLPSLGALSVTPVANQAARVALSTATVGTAVLQTDNGTIYVLSTAPYSVNGNWTAVNTGTAITSINGETGPTVTGYAKLSDPSTWANQQTFTVSPSIPTATVDDAPVPKAQLDTAIATVTAGAGPASRFTATFGNGSSTSFTFTHGRGTSDVVWNIYDVNTGQYFWPNAVFITGSTTIAFSFVTPPTTNQLRVVII